MGGITVTVLVEQPGATPSEATVVTEIRRDTSLCAGSFGLSLAEAKGLLAAVQRRLTRAQLDAHVAAQRHCEHCGARRWTKDWRTVRFRSLFGAIELPVPRLRQCACVDSRGGAETVRVEDLQNWTAPELEYVHARLGATVPYARASEIISLLLPAQASGSTSSVRRHTLSVARRLEAEVHAAEPREPTPEHTIAESPDPVTMGLDGGFVRHCRPHSTRSFEVVVGRIVRHAVRSRSLGFVRTFESTQRSRERIRRRVVEEGARPERMTLFTDGDIDLRDLQLAVLPEATHVLDWYHLSRKLTHLRQLLFGEAGVRQIPTWYHERLHRALSGLKWHLWHGQRWRAHRSLQALLFTMRLAGITGQPVVRKMRRHAKRLSAYLETNEDSLPDYGRRHRAGERVASSFVESAVNQLVDKRMSKSQQMRWSHAGAHLLLQVRAEVVDGRLGEQFERWYPGFGGAKSLPVAA